MAADVVEFVTRFVLPPAEEEVADEGVSGNSQLTGALGVILLVALFVEGLTLVIGVNQTLTLHIFIGFLVIPTVVAKIASTAYRMSRYYLGDQRYRRKGPPHPVLRVIGPLVILSTIALLVTGVAMLVVGGTHSRGWRDLHQTVFIVWVVLMSLHVLGHLLETWRLSTDEWAPSGRRVSGTGARRSIVALSVVVGVALGALSVGWTSTWRTAWESQRQQFHRPLHAAATTHGS